MITIIIVVIMMIRRWENRLPVKLKATLRSNTPEVKRYAERSDDAIGGSASTTYHSIPYLVLY